MALGRLLAGVFALSTGYGLVLLLPLYVQQLGGSEATFGVVTACAAVPAALLLGLLLRFPDRLPASGLLAAASMIYGSAACGLVVVRSVGAVLVVLGVILGATWAVVYTVAPMVVSQRVGDADRAAYIGYITGMMQLGLGLGPVIGGFLHSAGLSYPAIFVVAGGLAFGAAAFIGSPTRLRHRSSSADRHRTGRSSSTGLAPTLARTLRSPSAAPLLMILLAACLFTTMTSFQTTFAASRQLPFAVFYFFYTVAVILVRMLVARALPDLAARKVVVPSTAGITLAVLLFLAVGSNVAIYAAASALLGAAYGLALPAAQARAVNLAVSRDRSRMLPLAGLLFQVVILAFPLVAGAIIVAAGYVVLFGVLLAFSVGITLLGWPRRRSAIAAPIAGQVTVPNDR
jgi:MFS family permease